MLNLFFILIFDVQALTRREFCKKIALLGLASTSIFAGCQIDQFTSEFDPSFKMPKTKTDSVLHDQSDKLILKSFFSQSSLEFLCYNKTLYYHLYSRSTDEKIGGFHYQRQPNHQSVVNGLGTWLKKTILNLKIIRSSYGMTHKDIFSSFEKFSEKNQKEMEKFINVLNLKSVRSLDEYKRNVVNEIKNKFKLNDFNEKEFKIFIHFFKNRSKLYSISYDVAWSLFFYNLKFELIKEKKLKNKEKLSEVEKKNKYEDRYLKEILDDGSFKEHWQYYSENIQLSNQEYDEFNIFFYVENFFYNIHLKWKDYLETALKNFKGDEALLKKYFESNLSIEYEDSPDFVLANTATMYKENNSRKIRKPADLFEDLVEHFRQYQFGGFHVLTSNIHNPLNNLKGNYFKEIHDYSYRNIHLFHKGDFFPFLTVLERIEQYIKIYLTIGGDRDYLLSLIPFYLFHSIYLDKKDKFFLQDNVLVPQRMLLKDEKDYKQNIEYSKKNFSFDYMKSSFVKKNFLNTRIESKNSSRKHIGLNDWDYMSYISFYLNNNKNLSNLENYLVEIELFLKDQEGDDAANWINRLLKKYKRLKEIKNKNSDHFLQSLVFLYAYIHNPFQREFIYEEFYVKNSNEKDIDKKRRSEKNTFHYFYNVFTTKTL